MSATDITELVYVSAIAENVIHMVAGASGEPMFAIFSNGFAVIVALNSAQRVSREGKKVQRFSRETANIGV